MRAVISLSVLIGVLTAAPAVQSTETMETLQSRAKAGNAEAEYELARRYAGQSGDTLDLQQAFVYTRKSAEHGHRQAQIDLAFAYYNGNDRVRKDLASSFVWFKKAAAGGAVIAQCMLGDFYKNGLGGVKQDPVAAFNWYKRTATKPDRCAPKSQYELYLSYESGNGARKDLKTATHWLQTAAATGNPQAQATLGRNYAKGYGVPQDSGLAKTWLKKSREGVAPHEDHEHDDQPPPGTRLADEHRH